MIWKSSKWTQDGKKTSRDLRRLRTLPVKGYKSVYAKKLGRETQAGLDANAMIWALIMLTALEAAVHLGTNHWDNFQASRNQQDRSIQQLFSAC